MPIQKFDKPTCRIFAPKIAAALETLAAEYGLKVTYKGGSFDDLTFTAKVQFEVAAPAGGKGRAQIEFETYAPLFNLKPEHFGAEFTTASGTFKLSGLAPGRSKFPVLATRADGKAFKFTEAVIAKITGAAK